MYGYGSAYLDWSGPMGVGRWGWGDWGGEMGVGRWGWADGAGLGIRSFDFRVNHSFLSKNERMSDLL